MNFFIENSKLFCKKDKKNSKKKTPLVCTFTFLSETSKNILRLFFKTFDTSVKCSKFTNNLKEGEEDFFHTFVSSLLTQSTWKKLLETSFQFLDTKQATPPQHHPIQATSRLEERMGGPCIRSQNIIPIVLNCSKK